MGRLLWWSVAVIVVIQFALAGLVVFPAGLGTPAQAAPAASTVRAVAEVAPTTGSRPEDDVIVPLRTSVPAPPPRIPHSEAFTQLPVNGGAAVFIPARSGLAGTRMAIPNTSPGYSPDVTLTFDD